MDTLLRSEKTGKSTQLNSNGKRHDAQIFAPNCNSHHKILMVFQRSKQFTPARTLSINGLKSRVLKLSFLSLQMMVESGLEFILKLTEPLQRYLLSCQANSAILGRYFCTGQQQL